MAPKDTEAEIIAAASDIFMEVGYDGARMQAIADKAGINKALLHYYYKSKEHLFTHIVEHVIRHFVGELRLDNLPEEGFRESLQHFINHYIDTLHKHTHFMRFLSWELERKGATAGRVLRETLMRNGPESIPFYPAYKKAVEQGVIRDVPLQQVFLNVVGMCVYPYLARPIIERIFDDIHVDDPAFAEARKRYIFECIWQGIAGPKATEGEV